MPALPPGQARGLTLGLLLAVCACAGRTPAESAARADARYGSHGFAWLASHDPSSLVAWGLDPGELRAIAPDARVEAARSHFPCRQAATAHAALFVLVPRGTAGRPVRDASLDCGVALFRDARVLVIAPR